jgi:hypothetical protein
VNKKLVPLSIFRHIARPEELSSVMPLEEHYRVGDRVKVYIKDN